MGEPGGLPPMGSHRVGHDWSDLAAAAAAMLYIISPGLIYFKPEVNSFWPPLPICLLPTPGLGQLPIYFLLFMSSSFFGLVLCLDSTYEWDHTLSVSDISLSIMPSRSIHVVANDKISFFLPLNNIPEWVCLYKHIYHIFFIHSSIDGHLGCVQSESESHSFLSDSLRPHGLSMEFSRPEYWSG